MSLNGRIGRLESSARGTSACPACGLRPRDSGHIVVDDKDPVPELPDVCPACGRDTKIRLRVVYEGEEGEGA